MINRPIWKAALSMVCAAAWVGSASAQRQPKEPPSSSPKEPPFLESREFERFYLYEFDSLRQEAKQEGKSESAVPTPPPLEGPHSYGFVVVDAHTGEALPEATVHGFMLAPPDYQPAPSNVVGRLESHQGAAEGIHLYEKLPPGQYRFRVYADGYIPGKLLAEILRDGETGRVEMRKGGEVKGRLVNSESGAPIGATRIELRAPSVDPAKTGPRQNTRRRPEASLAHVSDDNPHYDSKYWGTTDQDGNFAIKLVPEHKYSTEFPSASGTIGGLRSQLEQRAAEERVARKEPSVKPIFDRLWREALERPHFILPKLPEIQVREGETLDLGILKVQPAPQLELSVKDEQGHPLADFSFEIAVGPPSASSPLGKFRTDAEGLARLPLVGFSAEDEWVAVFLPDRMEQHFQAFLPGETHPADPLAGFDEAELVQELTAERDRRMQEAARLGAKQAEVSPGVIEDPIKQGVEHAKQLRIQQSRRPAHPNVAMAKAQPGETVKFAMTYRNSEAGVSLKIAVRDKQTQKPIEDFEGRVASAVGREMELLTSYLSESQHEQSGYRKDHFKFASSGGGGRLQVASVPLSEEIIRAERRLKGEEPLRPGESAMLERQLKLCVAIRAPGYATQAFDAPLASVRQGKEMIFALEPEARVVGRVLLGKPSLPANAKAIEEVIAKGGIRRADRGEVIRPANVALRNPTVNGAFNPHESAQFLPFAFARVDDEGRFEIKGLRPGDRWELKVEAQGIPPHAQANVTLIAGLNHLGDIVLADEQYLAGFVMDQKGDGIEGARVSLPMTGDGPDERGLAGPEGAYQVPLSEVPQDRQVVRIELTKQTIQGYPIPALWYDAILELNRSKGSELNPKLSLGHTLTVELRGADRLKELADFYAREENWPYDRSLMDLASKPKAPPKRSFRAHVVAVLGLDATADGFASQRLHVIEKGAALEGESLKIEIPNVPPGRSAFRIDGTAFVQAPEGRGGEPLEKPSSYELPFAFGEFVMPDRDHQVVLDVAGASVEIELEDPPAELSTLLTAPMLILLDRIQPLATGVGGSSSQIFKMAGEAGIPDPERWRQPMVSYMCNVMGVDSSKGALALRKERLACVPPGRYRLSAYASAYEAIDIKGKPYFQTEIEIKPEDRAVRLAVPYQAPRPVAGVPEQKP